MYRKICTNIIYVSIKQGAVCEVNSVEMVFASPMVGGVLKVKFRDFTPFFGPSTAGRSCLSQLVNIDPGS